MTVERIFRALLLVCLAQQLPVAWSADFDESTDGDISGLRLSPTHLTLAAGSNLVVGTQGGPDMDFLHVVVPPGHVLERLMVLPGTVVGGGRSFIGVQRGDVFSVDPSVVREEDLLGYTHIDIVFAARDLLPDIGSGFGAQGYSGPLEAGDYTFWIMELATGSFPFRFDFVISPLPPAVTIEQVPALNPLAAAALFSGLVCMGIHQIRRKVL